MEEFLFPGFCSFFPCVCALTTTQWIAVSAVVTAIAGIATAIFIYQGNRRQSKLSRKQLKLSRKTSQAQLRAYISIEPHITEPEEHGKPLKFNVAIKNVGQTPAYRLTSHCTIGIFKNPFTKFPPPPEDFTPEPKYLPPGVDFILNNDTKDALTKQRTASIMKGTSSIYVFGKVEFVDAFDHKQWVTFKFEYGRQSLIAGASAAICQDGNDAS